MLLRVWLRQIELADIGPECPFFPDEGEFERHCDHTRQDIAMIPGVTSVEESGENQIMVSTDGLDLEKFKLEFKPIVQDHFCKLRVSQLEVVG